MKVVILAAAIGPTSYGAGQYERQVLPHLLPIHECLPGRARRGKWHNTSWAQAGAQRQGVV
jgi:hypothetical protein